MHLLQTLFSLAKKGQANALAIDGKRELAQSQAHWRYMITDLLRGLAKSHPYGQLTEKQRAFVHRAATKRGIAIPPPSPDGAPSIGPLPKRPPGR